MHQVVCADAREYLPTLPDGIADVVFLDPPYGIKASAKDMSPIARADGRGIYQGVTETWDMESETRQEQLDFISWYLAEAQRLVKPSGTVWIMGTYHNIHDVGHLMLNTDYFILNDIVYIKANPAPQWRGVRFCNSIESIIWARAHGKGPYYFDYHGLKALNNNKQMRADWYFPVCRGKERVKDETGKILHQTQKPLALLERIVLASVPPDGLIVDFLAGTGTTGIAAALHNRNSLQIERDPRYIEAMQRRFAALQIPFELIVHS